MEIDFSQDFARWTAEVAASPLQLRGASASPSPSAFRPVELFASPEGSPSLHDDVLSGISEPREDAFVSSQASVRQLEYGKLERWIAAGGSVENFAPWFREMLMDQDEHALVSALRAVAQHYRSSAQQQALGVQKEGQVFVPPVPCYWLPTLAERLKGTTEKVAHEAAKLVAAVLLAAPTRTADRRAVGDGLQADAEHEFFRRFALLELRAKGQLLAACKDVLQPEDYQVMAQAVSDEQELQVVVEDAVHETPSSPSLTSPGSRPCRSDALWANEPKTWRQRVRCLEHLAEQREGEGLGGLWPQLLLQVEDDHPAVSAAAMHCLACLAPQMSPPREHLVSRLANALRQRLREPRCRLRNAALELLNAVSGQRQLQLVSMTLQMPKDRVRKALQEAKRSEGAGAGPGAGEMSQLEALLSEAFPSRSGLNTPSPARLAITAISPQKPTPSTRTPSSTPEEVLQAGRTCDATPPQTFLKGQISTPPRKVLSLDCGRGSGEKLDKLPSDSKLLSFEATPDQRASTKANVVSGEEEDFQVDRSQKEVSPSRPAQRDDTEASESPSSLTRLEEGGTFAAEGGDEKGFDAAELTWSFQKLHMIILELSRPGCDEVALLNRLTQLLARPKLLRPLRRFLRRWLLRQRRRAAAKENAAPGKPFERPLCSSCVSNDYASLRELCSDEQLPGAFPHSLLSQLKLLFSKPHSSAVQKAAAETMEQCAIACGPVLRLALQPFAVPLLRLAAARPRLSAASSAARRAVQQLMGSWGGLRMVWRAWMQAICVGSRATTDQSLLAESLRLASESLHICGSGAELRRQVLQEIFSVAIDALSDQAYQIRDAAKQFFRAAEHALGTEQLQEEILDVAPSRLKLAMEALEHPGPQLAHASCAGGPRNGGQRKLRRPIRAAAILPARSTSTSVRDLEVDTGGLSPKATEAIEALQSDGAGGPCDSERRKAGEARYADIETLEAQILDYCDDLARSPTGKVDWPQRARDLQSSLQDIAMRYAQQSLVSLLLPLLTWVLRLCRAAEAASEEAVGLLKAAHEVMRTLRAFSTEVLRCIDPLPLFRSALQNLICLQVLSQKSDVIRRCTTPILLEVPPFLARLMDTVEAGKQLLAWLQLASELLLDKALKTTHSSLQARKSWALKFCARAVERCSANLQACDEVWAWEVLSEIARCWECLETGSDEWKQMLQALCSKIIQHHWSEAKEFAALAGTHGQLPAPLKELLVHRITA